MPRSLFLWISFCLIIAVFITIISQSDLPSRETQAIDPSPLIDLANTSSISSVEEKNSVVQFFVSTDTGYLYKSTQPEERGAIEFISQDPQVVNDDVQGVASDKKSRSIAKKLFPKELAKKINLVRKKTDPDGTRHFYFNQKIANKPVFGSGVSVHIRKNGEVYAMTGSLVLKESITTAVLTVAQAGQIATDEAAKEYPDKEKLQVVASAQTVFNVEGINRNAVEVVVGDDRERPSYATKFIVGLDTGDILFTEELIHHALNRSIYDCNGGLTNCPGVRGEGQPATNIRDVDLMYTHLGSTYNFFNSQFQRDSFDNQGAELQAFVNVESATVGCPNAAWIGSPYNQLLFCTNMVANDIVAHEFSHGVISNTAKLTMSKQSGALNEGIADIFSFGIDNDYTMAEDAITGIIRDASNPTADPPTRGGPRPDRLFSPYYYCASTDSGGVHANMTIITKAFYLMSEGGTFNGCSITSVGKTNALKIWYRALTTYLSASSNFGTAYSAVVQSCTDLFGSTSATCINTKKALQSTEIDQQPTSTQDGAICINQQRQTPQCAVVVTTPPVSITPSGQCALKNKGDADCKKDSSGADISLIDFEIWRKERFADCSAANISACGIDEDGDGSGMDANFNYAGSGAVNTDSVVDTIDFEIWRKGKFGS